MEMKYVVPDMAQSFGTLEFAGESEPVFERDKNNRKVIARRSYNLYSDVGFKREFSKLIGFLVVALIAVGLVFNAGGVKDVLLELFNKIIGA